MQLSVNYYGRTLSVASMLYFAAVFFHHFFPALVGQTAEQIFTKLSHVVDIRHHLRTYKINLFLALLKLHGGPKSDEILHIF